MFFDMIDNYKFGISIWMRWKHLGRRINENAFITRVSEYKMSNTDILSKCIGFLVLLRISLVFTCNNCKNIKRTQKLYIKVNF